MAELRSPLEMADKLIPEDEQVWWKSHCKYYKLNRQGIDIVCAKFEQNERNATCNVILVTGWSETFMKYATVIRSLYDRGFNIHTYDHQSQGLSGRWLLERQSTWVHSFEDYVDDFVFFVTIISRDNQAIPMYLLAHSMGGLISGIAMSRYPSLFNRACLLAPMFRNKCAMKALNYRFPLPQQIVSWLSYAVCYAGLGAVHSAGFFKENPKDELVLNVTTSDQEQLNAWQRLRVRHPEIMSTCVTNDWVRHSIAAQKKFSLRYEFVKTNTLILAAENDRFVHNRAMKIFLRKAGCAKMFVVPAACHELLFETENIRGATLKVVTDFFTQELDDVELVQPCSPIVQHSKYAPIYSLPETVIQATGMLLSAVGVMVGLAMMLSGSKR